MKGIQVSLTGRCLEIVNASKEPIYATAVHAILTAGGVFKKKKYVSVDSEKGAVSSILSVQYRNGKIRKTHTEQNRTYYGSIKSKSLTKNNQTKNKEKRSQLFSGSEVSQACLGVINSRNLLMKASDVADLVDIPNIIQNYKNRGSMVASVYKILDLLAKKKLILKTTQGGRSWFQQKPGVGRWIWKDKKGKIGGIVEPSNPYVQGGVTIVTKSAPLKPARTSLDIKLNELLEKKKLIEEDIQALTRTKELLTYK